MKLAGLMIDAGPVNSPRAARRSARQHGAHKSDADRPDVPAGRVLPDRRRRTSARRRPASWSTATTSSSTTSGHGAPTTATGVGWTVNTADTGVVVNGDDVTATGLFVEHYQKYNVIWNGERGRTIFFQNELPYDPPDQAAWRTTASWLAAYKVADSVKTHELWGGGSYIFTNVDPTIHASPRLRGAGHARGQAARPADRVLGGAGTIDHVVNDTGAAAQGSSTIPVNIVSYP